MSAGEPRTRATCNGCPKLSNGLLLGGENANHALLETALAEANAKLERLTEARKFAVMQLESLNQTAAHKLTPGEAGGLKEALFQLKQS